MTGGYGATDSMLQVWELCSWKMNIKLIDPLIKFTNFII